MGRLAVMIGGIEAEKTPLERRLEKFGGQIACGVLALAVLIAVGGLLVDGLERVGHVFLFAVALAVAAVPEGLPAVLTLTLALGLDKDLGALRERPRDPQAPLLDRESLRFILTAGCMKAAIGGGALLVATPLIGFSVLQTRTAVFLHATIGQLFYAYPARRINAPPLFNGALHLAVTLGVGLQLLTVLLPSLRTLLGLEPLTFEQLTLVSAAVLLTWGAAEAYSRIAQAARHMREAVT